MKKIIPLVAIVSILVSSCNVDFAVDDIDFSNYTMPGNIVMKDTILVDASRDGGAWWYPQSGSYNPSASHQGTPLVNYLKSRDYEVIELPRGATITSELLRKFKLVIRAGEFGTYTADELAAYREFLNRNTSLPLASEHSAQLQNDQLASYLGLQFEGSYTTDITRFDPHPITEGVSTHVFIAGSVVRNPDPNKILTLGYFSDSTMNNAAAMGIVKHPTSKIFFIGDVNGLELVPHPLIDNLFKWLK